MDTSTFDVRDGKSEAHTHRGKRKMGKRRTTVLKEIQETAESLTWEEGVEQFLYSLKVKGLAYHTMRWHRENLQAIEKALKERVLFFCSHFSLRRRIFLPYSKRKEKEKNARKEGRRQG